MHVNGATGRFYYPEILGPGVALFDYDNDGDLDVYLVQGRRLETGNGQSASPEPPLRGRLFRNDLQVTPDGKRVLHFTDVTEASGLAATGYGMGVATGDFDNDGFVDLYLTNFGASQLYHNNGNGTFTDVTAQSGTADQPGFGVSAAFLDYDRDGWLDLYVGNNVNYRLDNEKPCPNPAGARDYCPPQIYGGMPDRLYHNLGNGRFEDVTSKALIGGKFGPALGVSTADFNGDGWIDIFVSDDGEDNLLWINQRNGTFKESALAAGVAVTSDGKAEASMGVDAGDFDNDGSEDLIMTELTSQGSNLYLNDGTGRFRDASAASGLSAFTLPYTGWGTSFFDFDNDGWLDTLAVNGTIISEAGRKPGAFPYDQKKLLLRNLHNGRFERVTEQAGAVFELSESGRGAAFGDIDNDGDIDVLVGNDAGPVRLLINNIGNRKHWIGLRLVGQPTAAPRRKPAACGTCSAPASASCGAAARRCGAASDPMAATRQPTIRACSSALATRPSRRAFRCAGRTAAPRTGRRPRSIDGRRCRREARGDVESPGGERGDLRAAGRRLQRSPGRFVGRVDVRNDTTVSARHAGRPSPAGGGPA